VGERTKGMNAYESLRAYIEQEILNRQRILEWLETYKTALSELDVSGSVWMNQVDFDHLPHAKIIALIKSLGGKWDKTPNGEGRINYETEIGGVKVRCYNGEPPPNCKIVEELQIIPAQPERTVTVRRLVCQ
jgi:hypothetical protein